jgi:hypothetical protein
MMSSERGCQLGAAIHRTRSHKSVEQLPIHALPIAAWSVPCALPSVNGTQ